MQGECRDGIVVPLLPTTYIRALCHVSYILAFKIF